MNIPFVFWLVPIASVVALAMAGYFFRQMRKEDEGTPRMIEIAEFVRKVPWLICDSSIRWLPLFS